MNKLLQMTIITTIMATSSFAAQDYSDASAYYGGMYQGAQQYMPAQFAGLQGAQQCASQEFDYDLSQLGPYIQHLYANQYPAGDYVPNAGYAAIVNHQQVPATDVNNQGKSKEPNKSVKKKIKQERRQVSDTDRSAEEQGNFERNMDYNRYKEDKIFRNYVLAPGCNDTRRNPCDNGPKPPAMMDDTFMKMFAGMLTPQCVGALAPFLSLVFANLDRSAKPATVGGNKKESSMFEGDSDCERSTDFNCEKMFQEFQSVVIEYAMGQISNGGLGKVLSGEPGVLGEIVRDFAQSKQFKGFFEKQL